MISLRKHLEDYRPAPPPPIEVAAPLPPLEPGVAALRSTLTAMGTAGEKATPAIGSTLNLRLREISGNLLSPSPEELSEVTEQVNQELAGWAERAVQHHNENERELREIISVVARATEAIGRKDEKYAKEIGDVTGKMRTFADLKDIAVIRRSIMESATMLRSCVEKMTEESRSTLTSLSAEVTEYRVRMEAAEKTATLDPLTQICNRRAFEKRLELKISNRDTFSLILIDLNGFKGVNDTHGHTAGDELLRQFSTELKGQFAPEDTVSRWGGDEFAVLVAGDLKVAGEKAERVRRWVLGDYKIATASGVVKVAAGASLGVVQWNGRETALELVNRADQGLYGEKQASRTAAPRPAARTVTN